MHVCTIIAKNYVAQTRVLARSLAEVHPGSRLWTLVIDDFTGYLDPDEEPFTLLTPEQVGCGEFMHMAIRYSVLELSTAVKPWLLRYLMGHTRGPVTYLDPDIRIYSSIEHLDQLAQEHGVVLIPHNSRPIPQDGRKPSQVDVMIAGIYNLGFVSLDPRPEVDQLLDWWADRLRRDCRVDPVWGYFVDQRWFDLAPGFLSDLAIVRDPQYNLAYWNLHERQLEYTDGSYLVDGRPLGFFHFSGFDPAHPLVLSRHQDRVDVAAHPVLERLLDEYAAEVLDNGYATARHLPYDFAALGDGTRVDGKLGDLFDEFADAHDGAVPSPFTLEGVREFDVWLREPTPGAPAGINRALARVYEARADIRGAFPDLRGADRDKYLAWAVGPGADEEPLLARVAGSPIPIAATSTEDTGAPAPDLPAAAAAQAGASEARPTLRGAPWGVNVIGSFASGAPSAEVPRAMVEALDAGGVRALPVRDSEDESDAGPSRYVAANLSHAAFAVSLLCLDVDRLRELFHREGPELFGGRYSIALAEVHLDEPPAAWREPLSRLEELWAPSAHTAAALRRLDGANVHQVRIPVRDAPTSRRPRAALGLPADQFLFHCQVDYTKGFERQNPAAVVEAFRRAFRPEDGVGLVVACLHVEQARDEHIRLLEAASQHPDVHVVADERADFHHRDLLAACDCHVSLHRAEAFGMTMAEAMWFGKPVVATGYSGNLDYMSAETALLVDHEIVAVPSDAGPDHAVARWAAPDRAHAAVLMRQVRDDPDAARALGERAANSIRASHSPQAAGELLSRRLQSIWATGRPRTPADAMRRHAPALGRLPMKISQGPAQVIPGPGRRGRDQLRKAVLRAMRPFTAYQQSVNAEIATALAELSSDLYRERDRAATGLADLLHAARVSQFAQIAHLEGQTSGIEQLKRILTEQTDRTVYMALSELGTRHGLIDEEPAGEVADTRLTPFELRVFSQNGEDGVIAEILRRIGAPSRYFVEFGVESGREGNCVYLADIAGWRGLFMEAGEEMFRQLERKYATAADVRTVQARVTAANIEHLFAAADVPPEPDVVSIDVDGQDYWIWKAIESYRPRLLVVEYNSALDPRRRLVQPDDPTGGWDNTDFYGASVGALQVLGERKGYCLVHTDLSAVNAFFVREDLLQDAFPDPAQVAIRGTPNYYQRGIHHPRATSGARYLELDSGRHVSGEDGE